MQKDLIPFYLEGRNAKLVRIKRITAEPEEIAQMVFDGGSLRESIQTTVDKGYQVLLSDRKYRKTWERDSSLDEGVDADAAYAHYLRGVADELAYALETEVLECLDEVDGDDGDDDADEDEDEGEGDEIEGDEEIEGDD